MNISHLTDHKEVIPILAQWFYQEWSYLHPNRTCKDVEQLISERINTDKIPLTLVAFEGKELLGTVCLKKHDMDTRLDLFPWLAGLYVTSSWRRKGIGTALVSAIEKKAYELGVKNLYLYTPKSEIFYLKLGWHINQKTEYHGYPVTIMEKPIGGH